MSAPLCHILCIYILFTLRKHVAGKLGVTRSSCVDVFVHENLMRQLTYLLGFM